MWRHKHEWCDDVKYTQTRKFKFIKFELKDIINWNLWTEKIDKKNLRFSPTLLVCSVYCQCRWRMNHLCQGKRRPPTSPESILHLHASLGWTVHVWSYNRCEWNMFWLYSESLSKDSGSSKSFKQLTKWFFKKQICERTVLKSFICQNNLNGRIFSTGERD